MSAREVPNRVEMTAERLQRSTLDRYRAHNKWYHLYRAASRLWAESQVPWDRALQIVTEAFDACLVDTGG